MKPKLVTYIKKINIIISDAENNYDLLNKCEENCPEGFELLNFYDFEEGMCLNCYGKKIYNCPVCGGKSVKA